RRLEAALAAASRPVIVDAVHGERAKRRMMCEIAWRHHEVPILLWCQCNSAREVRRRFAIRHERAAIPEHEAADLSVFSHVASLWEDPADDVMTDGECRVVIYDTPRDQVNALDARSQVMAEIVAEALSRQPRLRRPRPA